MIIGDLITRNANLFPDKPAIKYENTTYTFAQFNNRVNQLVNSLAMMGVTKGDRIAFLSHNSPECLEIYGAAEKGGYIAVPLNWRLTPGELLSILQDCEPTALFVQHKLIEKILPIRDRLATTRFFIAHAGAIEGWQDYESVISAGTSRQPNVTVHEDDPAYLIYTSGTTGTPRGAIHTHRRQLAHSARLYVECRIQPSHVNLNVMPLFHIGGHTIRIVHSYCACLNIIKETFDALDTLKTIEQEKVTFINIVPSIVAFILDLPNYRDFDLSSLRTFFYAGSPMPVELLKRALKVFGPVFFQGYGSTEAVLVSLLHHEEHIVGHETKESRRLGSAGKPMGDVEIRIVDENDHPLGPEQPGEVCARSPFLMNGYWRRPEDTEKTMRGGWLHSGDIGFVDADGYLYVVDRKKDMIISGGENIYPRDVEEVLYQHPAVLEAAVIGVPDDKWVESVKALIVLKQGAEANEQEIIDFCKLHLAGYKKPRSVEFRAELPKSPSGKILKRELREAYWKGQTKSV